MKNEKSESEVTQSCLTLRDPMGYSYQAPPSMGFSRQEYWSELPFPSPQSYLTLCDPVDYSYQAPPSMGFSRQEYWSGLPFPSRGDFPNPGTEPRSPALQADALPSELPGKLK